MSRLWAAKGCVIGHRQRGSGGGDSLAVRLQRRDIDAVHRRPAHQAKRTQCCHFRRRSCDSPPPDAKRPRSYLPSRPRPQAPKHPTRPATTRRNPSGCAKSHANMALNRPGQHTMALSGPACGGAATRPRPEIQPEIQRAGDLAGRQPFCDAEAPQRLHAIGDRVVPEAVEALQRAVHLLEFVGADAADLLDRADVAVIKLADDFGHLLPLRRQADAD